MADEVEDFEAFLEPDFTPIQFANDLLLATNSIDNELDITTPSKRMNFDLIEVNKRMNKLSSDNYELLFKEATKMNDTKKILDGIEPSLQHVQTSFKRLEYEILKPYEEAQSLNEALKRLHTTSMLLRGVTYFIYLVKEIEEYSSIEEYKANPKNLIKSAKTHKQLMNHLKDSSNLMSLKIVRDFELIGDERRQNLISFCQLNLKKMHVIDNETLLNSCAALAILSPDILSKSVSSCIEGQVTYCLTQLTRVLTSPRNFANTMIDVSARGKLISNLQNILKAAEWPELSETFLLEKKEMILDVVLKEMNYKSLISLFWRDLATSFEKKFKETLTRGGPVAKSLRVYSDSIKSSISKNVLNSSDDFDENCIEIKLMLASVSSLNTPVRR